MNLLQWFAQFAVVVMVVGALAIISRVDLRDIGWRPPFVTATILGVVASWLYERSGSLVPAITLHALNNFLAQGLSYVFLFIGLQLGV